MPAIYFFGSHLATPLYPGTVLLKDMSPSDLWRTYVRPMGAGAVAASGLITLLRTGPTIIGALTQGLRNIGNKSGVSKARPSRTEHDLRPIVVFGGSLLLALIMFLFLQFKPVAGAQVGALANIAAALLVVVFGFLFICVSARIVDIVGSSSNPVFGMTIATLMATAAVFLVKGWTAPAFGALAITIGGVVCVAITNAGDTSQDLKTGYLIGANAVEAAGRHHGRRPRLDLLHRRYAQRNEYRTGAVSAASKVGCLWARSVARWRPERVSTRRWSRIRLG
jgi:uncharacterized oligopeptide transporter (OPT) family protein